MPSENWTKHSCRVLYTGSFMEAEKRLRKAEETSDLQSGEENIPAKRKKIARRRLAESDSSCEEEALERRLPKPPLALRTPPHALSTPLPSVLTSPTLPTPPPAFLISQPELSRPPSSKIVSQTQRPSTPRVSLAASIQGAYLSRSQEARDTRIFTLLESMNDSLEDNNRLLRQLMARGIGGVEAAVPTELPEGIIFPLKTVDDLEAVETRLDDETTASSVVKYIADLGGRDVQDTVSRTMKTLIDNNLAKQYNFTGHKGKRKFEGLNITGINFRCLRMNPITRQASMKDMEAAVTKWLGGARDRNGRQKSRDTLRRPTLATPPPGWPSSTP
ncbi:uncharacterized protein LOC127862175 isoform X2 [Dreissena polymorpha]|nr:uncharacterized protein LOC127862175 isoform X2 [Dreissena polymorpha]